MLAEYGALFSSDKFNICADETFDLGCEKSRGTAEQIGTEQMYVDYLKELCGFLDNRGKRVQFSGISSAGSRNSSRSCRREPYA